MQILKKDDNTIVIKELIGFNLENTFNCGQCFRHYQNDDKSFSTVAFNKYIRIKQTDDTLTFYNTTLEDVTNIWVDYFDISTDYNKFNQLFLEDDVLKTAISEFGGIHILRQDPWEAICSFIISQNNNIPRIKGIISRLCENFGEKIPLNIENNNTSCDCFYTFPTAQKLLNLTVEDLNIIKAGFRGKYILDAAQKIANNIVNIEDIKNINTQEAKNILMNIKGIGPKVADCSLLFGFYKIDAFPIDVWVKKILAKYYTDGFPEKFNDYAGIAQQYLFMYEREKGHQLS